MNAYLAHFRTTVKEDVRYLFTDTFLGCFAVIGFIVLMLLFWAATGQTLFFGLYTWPMMVWYVIIVEVILNGPPDTIKIVNAHIQEGTIVTMLTKPLHYLPTMVAMHMGKTLVTIPVMILMTAPIGLFLVGTAGLSLGGIAFGALAALLGILIDFMLSLCIALIAFWTEDSTPYRWVYGKILFLFGGLIFPLDVLPSGLAAIAKLLPPAYILYHPARLAVDFSWSMLGSVLIGQIAYLVALCALAIFIYRLGIRKVSINGG